MPKMNDVFYENHQGSLILTLLSVLGLLGVLNMLSVKWMFSGRAVGLLGLV